MNVKEHIVSWIFSAAQAHPFLLGLVILVGVMRPFGIAVNLWLDMQTRKAVQAQQYWDLQEATGAFWWINLVFQTITSISLVRINAAYVVANMGDADTSIHLPHKTMTEWPVPDKTEKPHPAELAAHGIAVETEK